MENNGKTTVILTYNSVRGYESGVVYQGKKGLVEVIGCDNCKTEARGATARLQKVMGNLVSDHCADQVGTIYFYTGQKKVVEETLEIAKALKALGKDLKLVACKCEAGLKRRVANEIKVPIIRAECGGCRTLGDIVDKLLGKK